MPEWPPRLVFLQGAVRHGPNDYGFAIPRGEAKCYGILWSLTFKRCNILMLAYLRIEEWILIIRARMNMNMNMNIHMKYFSYHHAESAGKL